MNDILEDYYIREVLTTLIFLGVLLTLRMVLIRLTQRGSEVLSKDQRRWIVRIKNTAIVMGVFGVIFIWAPQIHTVALSLTAIAVAVVVALKEVILCITAAFVRVTTTPFKVGDWIVLEGQAGEVVDIDAFTMRMQEVDLAGGNYDYTGRMISIPNSKIFTANIINLNLNRKGYMFHDVEVRVDHKDVDPVALMGAFETIVKTVYAGHHEKATDTIRRAVKKTGLGLASPEPVITLETTDIGHYHLQARLFLPVEKIREVSTAIVRDTLAKAYDLRNEQLKRQAA